MKTNIFLTALVLLIGLVATAALAQDDGEVTDPVEPGNGHGVCQFVDEDGDGFNDLAPDADGDGIPNGLDPDYVKPEDGTGMQYGWGKTEDGEKSEDGELFGHFGEMEANGNVFHYGLGDGTGTSGPNEDGTGFGPGTGSGDGPQDGEGVAEGRQERIGEGGGKQ